MDEPVKKGSWKTSGQLLVECGRNGFSQDFCDFIRSLMDCRGIKSKKDKTEIIEGIKRLPVNIDTNSNEAIGAVAEIIGLMEAYLENAKKIKFRTNQIIALCSYLIPTQVTH